MKQPRGCSSSLFSSTAGKVRCTTRVNILWLGTLMLLLGAGGAVMAADPSEDAGKAELQKFQGTWVLVAGEIDGKKVAEEHVKQSKITFDGTTVMVDTPHQSTDTIVAMMTKLDPTTTLQRNALGTHDRPARRHHEARALGV